LYIFIDHAWRSQILGWHWKRWFLFLLEMCWSSVAKELLTVSYIISFYIVYCILASYYIRFTLNICSFVYQCNINFLFFIIRRHVLASHGHLQVLQHTLQKLVLWYANFLPMSGCQSCASHVLLLMVCLLSVSVCYNICVVFVAAMLLVYNKHKRSVRKAENFTGMLADCLDNGGSLTSTTLKASMACYRDSFTFFKCWHTIVTNL
jgi:hypothetical protein